MARERKSRATLLLLSGGSLVGQSIVHALGDRRRNIRLLATNSIAQVPSLQDFDQVRLVLPTCDNPTQLGKAVIDWLEEELPTLVVPCRDDDVVFLARLAEHRPEFARYFLCGASGPAEIMSDKWQSWEMCCEHSLPFAPTLLPTDSGKVDAFVRNVGFPLVIKPRFGFASSRVTLAYEPAQLEHWIGSSDMVFQKYLGHPRELDNYMTTIRNVGIPLFHSFESAKHSIQVMIAPDGELEGVFTTLHRMKNGVSTAVDTDHSEDAQALGIRCGALFRELGWRGPVNIQCQRTPEGELGIYEFNGRFTGATGARVLLGFDEVGMALRRFSGIEIGAPVLEGASSALRQPGVFRVVRQHKVNRFNHQADKFDEGMDSRQKFASAKNSIYSLEADREITSPRERAVTVDPYGLGLLKQEEN